MTQEEADQWNARYGQFYLTRYSPAQMRHIQVGKPRRCILDALAAAKKADDRNPHGYMTFIDTDQPR